MTTQHTSAGETTAALRRISEHVFHIGVTFVEGYYVAECDEIPLATEAATYEALIERARLIAPEIAELNGFLGKITLEFQPDPRS